jgi:hypothetical protein
MADDKKKKSADEIVDEMAEDMGVDGDEKVAASDESAEDVMGDLGGIFGVSSKKKKKKKKKKAEEPEASDDEPEEADDEAEGADEEAEEADEEAEEADEEAEEADEEEAEEEKVAAKSKKSKDKKADAEKPAKKKEKKKEAIEGIFTPGDEPDADDSYLSAEDLGDIEPAMQGGGKGLMIGALAFGVLVIGGIVIGFGPDNVMAVLKGEYREKKLAAKEQAEEEYMAEQLAKMNKFGDLIINGNPMYANVTLNGKPWYGMTKDGWRKFRIGTGTPIQNLNIKDPIAVEVSAPGFQPFTEEMTEGKWQESTTGGSYSKMLSANLTPQSPAHKIEFDQRIVPDVETEYFGTITINSTPPGAQIDFNNAALLDEQGNPMVTPVTFQKYWVRDNTIFLDNMNGEFTFKERVKVGNEGGIVTDFNKEKKTLKVQFDNTRYFPADDAQVKGEESGATAQVNKTSEMGKLEEKQVNVDTTLDIGHKIEIFMDYPNQCATDAEKCVDNDGCCPANPECNVATDNDCKYPRMVESLQRQMWTCTFDEEKKNKAMETGEGIQEACTYTYTLNADLDGIATYAKEREAERQRIIAQMKAEGVMSDSDAGDAKDEAAE